MFYRIFSYHVNADQVTHVIENKDTFRICFLNGGNIQLSVAWAAQIKEMLEKESFVLANYGAHINPRLINYIDLGEGIVDAVGASHIVQEPDELDKLKAITSKKRRSK
jgi:hypothetical protein